MEPVVLLTARLVLDAPREQDVDAVFEACQDEAIQRWTTVPSPYRRQDAETFVRRVVPGGWASGSEETWAIRERADGPLLGVIGARRATDDVGYWLAPAARGNGFVAEALEAVVRHRFAAGQEELGWECLVGNVASARAARRAGFRFTGVAPSRIPERDGSLPPAWHARLSAHDAAGPKPGWPAEVG